MRKFFLLATTAILTACSGPDLDVKAKWSESILNYAMVPLYPMREDVYVGDIRIHVVEAGGSKTLDSRLLGRMARIDKTLIEKERRAPDYSDPEFPKGESTQQALTLAAAAGIPQITGSDAGASPSPEAVGSALIAASELQTERWKQPTYSLKTEVKGRKVNRLPRVVLPRLDAARITRADAEAMGIVGIWNWLVGGKIEDEETLMISLTKLESAELADPSVIKIFHDQIERELSSQDSGFLYAVCHAALSWGDPEFKATAISMVSRVFYARGVQYSYGENFGAALQATINPAAATGTGLQDGKLSFGTAEAGRMSMNEEFNAPMAFGVDAVMLNPTGLVRDLPSKCKSIMTGFYQSPLKTGLRTDAFGN